nr:immunoglobulin light chain junction region [Macaca mulatta]
DYYCAIGHSSGRVF